MPWYDFHCEECGLNFEKFMGIDDDRTNLDCPNCSSKKVVRDYSSISSSTDKEKKTSSNRCYTGG
jgi:putative FmdB family regulatory protein